jgi:hypothetical protein
MYPAWYVNVGLSILLQSLLFWRGCRCGLLRRYPFFYTYLIYTASWSVIFSLPVLMRQPGYAQAYWWSHLLAATLRYGIAADVYRNVFPVDSPLRKRASGVILLVLLLLALAFWLGGVDKDSNAWFDALRKIALSVAALIFGILGLARYYGVWIGRNVWGMAAGLIIFMGSELVHLAAMDLFPQLSTAWGYVHPLAFVFMILIWTFNLWNYYPNRETSPLSQVQLSGLLSEWHGRWTQVPEVLRRVAKS